MALWEELRQPGRPRVLLTLDGLPHVMRRSEYMSASFEHIHAHDLALVSWFLSHLSGKLSLPNGGIVLAATTESNRANNTTLSFRLKQLEAKQALRHEPALPQTEDPTLPFLLATGQKPAPFPQLDPLIRYDRRVLDVLACSETLDPNSASNQSTDIEIQRLKGLDKEAARGLMEYWAQSGMMRYEINDRFVGEKWTISGGGVVGELERGCLKLRI